MEKGFEFQIVTPVKRVHLSIDATSVVVPAYEGFLGVLYNHAPLVAVLQPGPILLKKGDRDREVFACAGGVFVVNNNKAVVLADAAEPAKDIDLARAEKAYDRAKQRVASAEKTIDRDRAERALKRAKARLDVARGLAFSDS